MSGLDHKLVEIDSAHVTRMNYTLGELIPFTEYDIAVEACTKECSNPTKTKIKTTIGAPGNLFQPSIKTYHNHLLKNYTSAAIGWDEPTLKGGELDYYEFKSTLTTVDDKMVENIVKTRNTRCYIEQLCTGNIMSYEFSVRAVNFVRTPHSKESKTTVKGSSERQNCERDDEVLIKSLDALKIADPHGWHLPGPWAQAVGHSCHYGGLNAKQNVIMLFMVIASLVIAVMVFYIYRKYKDMKDILVQMPPGLEDLPCDKMKKGKDVGNMETIPDILSNIDNVSINCEDENGQLLKKSLNGSLNEAECSSSLHSESTRSELENDDEIEYGEFGNDKVKHTDEGLQVSLNRLSLLQYFSHLFCLHPELHNKPSNRQRGSVTYKFAGTGVNTSFRKVFKAKHHSQPENDDAIEWLCDSTTSERKLASCTDQQQRLRDAFNV